MSILRQATWPLLNWFSSSPAPASDAGQFWERGGGSADTGVYVSQETAMTLSAVYAAVSLISETIASLPVGVYSAYGGRRYARPRPQWLSRPNLEQDWPAFIAMEMVGLLLAGKIVAAIIRDASGLVQELWPLDPRLVVVRRNPQTHQREFVISGEVLRDDQVLFIPGPMLPGHMDGMSIVEQARQTIGLGRGYEKFAGRTLYNQATPSMVVTSDHAINDETAEAFAKRIERLMGGLDKAGKVAVFGNGAHVQALTMTHKDLQFLEARKFQVEEVARWFRVPPHMIGEVDRSTSWGTGIEEQGIMFVQHTLTPWLVRLEAALSPHVAAYGQASGIDTNTWYAKFNVNALLRSDSAARAALYQTLFATGAASPNWILSKEDENGFSGGDAHYVQMSYAPIDANGALPQPAGQPAQQTPRSVTPDEEDR